MLGGLAFSAACAAGAVHFGSLAGVSMVLTILSFTGWCVGVFAMVGYVRWIYASEVRRMAGREDGGGGK